VNIRFLLNPGCRLNLLKGERHSRPRAIAAGNILTVL
jgi:hypothetical protein